MERKKENTSNYRGIHILVADQREYQSYICDDGGVVVYMPIYLEKKIAHVIIESTNKDWSSSVLSKEELENGTAFEMLQDSTLDLFIGSETENPIEIFLLLVTHPSLLKAYEDLTYLTMSLKNNFRVPIFAQKIDSFHKVQQEALRQHLDSKYGVYCIEMKFADSMSEEIGHDEMWVASSTRILRTNQNEIDLRDMITKNNFCL